MKKYDWGTLKALSEMILSWGTLALVIYLMWLITEKLWI